MTIKQRERLKAELWEAHARKDAHGYQDAMDVDSFGAAVDDLIDLLVVRIQTTLCVKDEQA